jgi:hypothetical protein
MVGFGDFYSIATVACDKVASTVATRQRWKLLEAKCIQTSRVSRAKTALSQSVGENPPHIRTPPYSSMSG